MVERFGNTTVRPNNSLAKHACPSWVPTASYLLRQGERQLISIQLLHFSQLLRIEAKHKPWMWFNKTPTLCLSYWLQRALSPESILNASILYTSHRNYEKTDRDFFCVPSLTSSKRAERKPSCICAVMRLCSLRAVELVSWVSTQMTHLTS